MIGYVNDRDIELHSMKMSGTYVDEGALDTFKAGFGQGIVAGPVVSAVDFLRETFDSSPALSAEEANAKYGLTGTPIAFKEGETTTEGKAQLAAERFAEDQYYNEVREAGVTGFGFLGNLAAGFVDPINLATGVGMSAVVKKVGMMTTSLAMSADVMGVLKNTTPSLKNIAASQLAENFFGSVVVDAAITPLAEDVRRRPTNMSERIVNVLGSTVLGAGLGTLMEPVARTHIRQFVGNLQEGVGSSQAEKVAKEITQHVTATVSVNKRPDVESIIKKNADILTLPRDTDVKSVYTRKELPSVHNPDVQLSDIDFYVGNNLFTGELQTNLLNKGDGTYTFVDDHNVAKNNILDLEGNVEGELASFRISSKANILHNGNIYKQEVKTAIRQNMIKHLDALGKDMDLRGSRNQRLNEIFRTSNSIEELESLIIEQMYEFLPMEDVHNVMNKSYYEAGFQGKAGIHAFANGHEVNAVTVFRPEVFEPNYKGKRTMELGKGSTTTNALPMGKAREYGNSRLFYNSGIFENVQHGGVHRFDPELWASKEYLKNMDAKYKHINENLASYKSDIDYVADDMAEMNGKTVVKPADVDIDTVNLDEEFDNLGITKEEVKLMQEDSEFAKNMEYFKGSEKIRQAQKAYHACRLGLKG